MTAIRVLVAQHRDIQGMFDDVIEAAQRDLQASAVAALAEEMIAHVAAEEAVFYPAVRRALGGGGAVSSQLRGEPLELRVALRRVLEAEVGDDSFARRLHALRALFDRHVQTEETQLFPQMQESVAKGDLEVLGEQIV